jgi:hypothetical protein
MAKREDDEAPAIDATRLLIAGPKAENDSPIIDLEPLGADAGDKAAEAQPSEADAPQNSGRKLPSYAPLAAGIALAVAVGALAGAGATASLMRDDPSPASLSAAHDNRVLRDSVAQLGSELATLKAGIATAQRNASTQFGKLAERLDRAEKAQAEPAARLAKIQESLDRLDHRQQQAAATPAPAPVAAPEVTGSIAAKEETRPPLAEGWRMRDFHAGRAIVQSRNGTLFEVGPGSNLPGLGRVESIKREKDQVVVIAQNGTIAGSVAQRRPAYFLPYRY